MSLKDFHIRFEPVTFVGGTLLVRGVSLNDVSALAGPYMTELQQLFAMYEAEDQRETALQESVKFAVTIVRECPEMVAQLIVLASDSDQADIEIAKRLPLPAQVELIRKIFELTFEEAGGAKKFVDTMVALVKANRPAAKQD